MRALAQGQVPEQALVQGLALARVPEPVRGQVPELALGPVQAQVRVRVRGLGLGLA